jgi:hypothetical protein
VLLEDALDQQRPAVRAGASVSVKVHPGLLLGAEWLRHLSASSEARMNNVSRDYS